MLIIMTLFRFNIITITTVIIPFFLCNYNNWYELYIIVIIIIHGSIWNYNFHYYYHYKNLKSLISEDLKLNGDFIFDEKLLEALSYNILIRNIPANFGNIDISNVNLTTHEDLVDLIASKINIKDLLEAFPYIPIFNFPRVRELREDEDDTG